MNKLPDNEPHDFEAEPDPEPPASEPDLVLADASPFEEPEGVRLLEGATSPDWLVDCEASPFEEPSGGEVEEE